MGVDGGVSVVGGVGVSVYERCVSVSVGVWCRCGVRVSLGKLG